MHEHARNKANRNPVRLWIIEDRYRNENQHEIPRGGDFFGRRNFGRIKGGSKRRIFFFFFFREVYASLCSFFFFLGEKYILNFISYPVKYRFLLFWTYLPPIIEYDDTVKLDRLNNSSRMNHPLFISNQYFISQSCLNIGNLYSFRCDRCLKS